MVVLASSWNSAGYGFGGGYEHVLENGIVRNGKWKEFLFYTRGKAVQMSAEMCPKTFAILSNITELRTCFIGVDKFSRITPGTKIIPHCGPTNFRLTAHLGLVVPPNVKIRVSDDILFLFGA